MEKGCLNFVFNGVPATERVHSTTLILQIPPLPQSPIARPEYNSDLNGLEIKKKTIYGVLMPPATLV